MGQRRLSFRLDPAAAARVCVRAVAEGFCEVGLGVAKRESLRE